MNLFEYAVIFRPKSKEGKKLAEKEKLIVPPTHVLAENAQAALLLAARNIPEQYADRLSEVEVLTRPF